MKRGRRKIQDTAAVPLAPETVDAVANSAKRLRIGVVDMNRLNRQQQEAVRQLITFTNVNDMTAVAMLEAHSWDMQRAVNAHFENPGVFSALPATAYGKSYNKQTASIFFSTYADDPKDNLPGRIGPNGVMRLLENLNVDPTDCSVLIFAWKLNAKIQCEFTKEEWMVGTEKINCDTIDKLRSWFRNARSEIKNQNNFRNFYNFTFNYAKSVSHRGLPLEVAIAYWRIIFTNDKRVEHWINWLEVQGRGITRDEWQLYYDFYTTVAADLSNYDSDSAWPSRIDEYVEFCKAEMNGESMES